MKLMLTTDQGVVLDTVEVTVEEWLEARQTQVGSWSLLEQLDPDPLPETCRECSTEIGGAEDYGMCDSCLHDALRSGWNPGDDSV